MDDPKGEKYIARYSPQEISLCCSQSSGVPSSNHDNAALKSPGLSGKFGGATFSYQSFSVIHPSSQVPLVYHHSLEIRKPTEAEYSISFAFAQCSSLNLRPDFAVLFLLQLQVVKTARRPS